MEVQKRQVAGFVVVVFGGVSGVGAGITVAHDGSARAGFHRSIGVARGAHWDRAVVAVIHPNLVPHFMTEHLVAEHGRKLARVAFVHVRNCLRFATRAAHRRTLGQASARAGTAVAQRVADVVVGIAHVVVQYRLAHGQYRTIGSRRQKGVGSGVGVHHRSGAHQHEAHAQLAPIHSYQAVYVLHNGGVAAGCGVVGSAFGVGELSGGGYGQAQRAQRATSAQGTSCGSVNAAHVDGPAEGLHPARVFFGRPAAGRRQHVQRRIAQIDIGPGSRSRFLKVGRSCTRQAQYNGIKLIASEAEADNRRRAGRLRLTGIGLDIRVLGRHDRRQNGRVVDGKGFGGAVGQRHC